MVKAIIAIIAAIIVVTGVIFAADAMLKQYGLDLSSLLNILFASMSASDVNAMEFDDVNSSRIGEGTYETLSNEKEQLEDVFEYARPMIDELNNDTELTSAMMGALGEYYVVYL
jgi:antitoxin component of RelBE/YafQ-DinJ toxin-antitoxin module